MPTPVKGSTKYGTAGRCSLDLLRGLNLPAEVAQSVANWGNLGITKKTWSTYKTAETMLKKCEAETKVDTQLPLTTAAILTFIDWLARVRKLKAATINSYLSGIRQLHIIRGLKEPNIKTGLAQLVLKGIQNRDGIASRAGENRGRLPMTKNVMLLFKQLVKNSNYPAHDKLLIWAVSTIAFAGAFRIHEILEKNESTYDPDFSLLKRDITISESQNGSTIHITLKCPKESRTAATVVVDIFQNDSPLCPVRAFRKWEKLKVREPNMPAFRLQAGTPLTGAKLNRIMKELLGPYTDRAKGFFATHSFRIGLASMLGQAGLQDQEIMAAGRWSSRVFERYLKLARTKRALVQHKISSL